MLKFYTFLCSVLFLVSQAVPGQDKNIWKGDAILGARDICFVYSDDPRIVKREKTSGIRHLYFKDYTIDYLASTEFSVSNESSNLIPDKADFVSLKDDCIAATDRSYASGTIHVYAYGAAGSTVAIRCVADPALKQANLSYTFNLRKEHITSQKTTLSEITIESGKAVAKWSNGIMAVISGPPSFKITKTDSSVTFLGSFSIAKSPEFLLTMGDNFPVIEKDRALNLKIDTYTDAVKRNHRWLHEGKVPAKGKFAEENMLFSYFNRTLIATRAACIRGQIPADMTGQYVTNNMPQLYPRDAMKSARVLLETGHLREAKEIISFWANPSIPKKSKGEFYARYDAYAHAVDAGSGSRFDQPEWDANGYLIRLLALYHDRTGEWLADKSLIYDLADFLCSHLDEEGLLYEGGIIEWTGYLPATNMICQAGLETAAGIATKFGDKENAAHYKAAAATIYKNLPKMIDPARKTFTDVRYHGGKAPNNMSYTEKTTQKLYFWDVTPQFAPLWGFKDLSCLAGTIEFYEKNCYKLDGGFEYFEATEPGIAGYGNDVFFFTSAAMAQYYCLVKQPQKALPVIRWMVKNSNCYGMMPERIYLNNTDCSDASPLSWCNAEFALAVLEYTKTINPPKVH